MKNKLEKQGKRMRDRAKVFTMALVFVFLISTLTTVSAKEIIVDSNSNGDFIHIQAAINAALLGDKIIVKPGTYVEDITIKKNLTVVSESGNSSDTIIKSANGSDDIFSVWSNSVSIKGFSINGARYAGIHLFGVNNCNITNNNLSNNGCGIDLYMFSSGNTLANNQISNSVTGISLGDSLFNSLRNNSVSNCGSAISIFDSRNNTLRNNLVFNNSEGISLIGESNGNTLTGNIVISNTKTGLHLYGASDNLIHNNYFNNAENVEFEESESTLGANIWNKNKTVGTDVVGGQYLGGNFWAKPDGTGFSQISEDSDRDGICDFYYNISKNEIDYLPLVSLSSPEKPVLPISNESGMKSNFDRIIVKGSSVLPEADFMAFPTSGNAPLYVQFIDLSKNATGWNWNFGDGNTSTAQYPTNTYSKAGKYTVSLTVTNENYTNSKTLDITVTEAPIEEKVPPVASFDAYPTSGNAPLSVQFTDKSTGSPTSWSWDFNNDGIADSSTQSPAYTYNTPGTYVAKLTVSNADGTNSITQNISVYGAPIEEKVPLVANFNANITSGNAPLTVQFTDHSQNATLWSWDFNNDGIADSSDINPIYTYNTPGTYVAKLTVSNVNGTMNKTETITVTDGSSSGGSSSGGSSGGSSHSSSGGSSGGGGAGGSPEPQSNVEVKELSQAFITSGSSVKFDFPNNATSVLYITFNSKKTAGKTTTIVEMLKGKSTLVSQLPSGEVYKSLNIWVGNSGFATPSNIENSVVCFKVEKSWMQGKGINQSSISLNRYSDKKWNSLPTSLQGEDNNYFYFTAQTPGFSPFAITGNSTVKETVTKTQPADTKIQPGANVENVVQNNTASKTVQGSILNSEQKSQNGKSSSLPIFGMICMIALLLVAFLFKVDKKP